MASLQSLPAELLDKILLQVSLSDVLSLALTSQKLHSATEEHLYSNVKWTWDGGDGSTARVPLDLLRPRFMPAGPLYLFRTILHRPDLALRVSHFSVNFDPSWQDLGCEPPLRPRDFRLVDDLIQQTQLPDPALWKSAIARGSIDAAIALLVSQMSNLSTLSVGYNSFFTKETCTKDTLLETVLQHSVVAGPAAKISRFPRLSEVSLTAGRPSYQLQRPGSCLALLHSPNLQSATFAVDYAHSGRLGELWPTLPFCAAALTTLRFKRSRIGAAALEQILPFTPNLTVFEMDYCFQRIQPGFNGSHLTTLLKNCKSTLERIVIATSLLPPYHEDYRPEHWISSRIDSLREFSALQYLEIDLVYLTVDWGSELVDGLALSDVLPSNIHTLRIRHDFMHYPWHRHDISLQIYKSLGPFLPRASSSTPELQSIEILERCGDPVQGCYKDDEYDQEGYAWEGSEDYDGESEDDEEESEFLRYSKEEISGLCEYYSINCIWISLRQPCASLDR